MEQTTSTCSSICHKQLSPKVSEMRERGKLQAAKTSRVMDDSLRTFIIYIKVPACRKYLLRNSPAIRILLK